MRKPKLLLAFIAFFLFASNGDASILGLEVDEEQMVTVDGSTIALKNDYIPLIIINTNDNEEPTCEAIEAPDGLIGPSITNAEKVKGAMVITLGDETIYESGDYKKDESGLTIKVRGSSSAYKDKKSYKIKLQKKADLLNPSENKNKDKEWVLLSNDGYLTNDMVGFIVSSKIQNVWTPSYEYVNVVINGDYKGIYLLAEQVKQASCRIDVDEDTGYIVEYDPYWWNEDAYFESSLSSTIGYSFKQPDSDDVTEDQIAYISNAISEMEASLKDGTYPDYIDVESFARWILAHDLLGTSSEFGSNMFLSKNDDTSSSKFMMETLWDFDSIEKTQDEFSAPHLNTEFYYDSLFNSENTELLDEYQTIWNENSETIVDEIISDLSELKSSSLAEAIDLYSEIDKIVSGEDYPTFQEQIEESISWLTSRKVWLDENISNEIEDDEPTVNVGDETIPLKDLYNESIPLIIVNTVDAEEPTCDPIEAPDGLIGPSITNAEKVKGAMVITLGDETIYESGEYVKDESGLTIKVRGSSSAYKDKKSYKIKLQKKADLLDRGNKDLRDKEWVLLSNDGYLTNDMVGFLVSSKIQNVWTPSYEFVNVVINGDYKGIYLLAEQVKQASSRIDVDEDTGYIVEYDPHWWTEDVYFDSSLSSIIKYTFTQPDSDDVEDDQLDYISNAVSEMEASLKDGTYPDYIDVESFARWILAHDLLGTSSEFGSNMFLSKNDDKESSKFMMETLWDFDSIEKTQDEFSAPHLNQEFYYDFLFNSENTELLDEYQTIWSKNSETIVDEIISDLSEIKESSLAEAIDYYSEIDKIVSGEDYPEFSKQIEESISWFKSRKVWLDENISIETEDDEPTVNVGDGTIPLKDLYNESIPLIIVNTVDAEEPTCDSIEAPDGLIGPSITNADKVKGGMVIILGNETIYDSGDYEKDESGLTIKVRGSSSANMEKKSYKIKLQKKADLLNRGDDKTFKDKEWVLLNNKDYLSKDMVGFLVSSKMQNVWTPSYEFANVVINGNYKGIYLLTEQVKQASSRIDVDEDTGYIVEYDPHWWTEDVYFDSSLSSIIKYTFKHPDSDDVTQDQVDYIADAVEEMESSLLDGTYPDYIDVESFACWILTHDLLGTSSEFGSNMFLSKNDDKNSSKFMMETLWDFDSIEKTQDDWSAPHLNSEFYFSPLFNSDNTELFNEYQSLWAEKSESVVNEIISDLSEIKESSLAEVIDLYSEIDKIVSGVDYPTFSEQIEESISWFTSRKLWLDENISIEEEEPTVLVGDDVIPLKDLYNENIPLLIVNTVDSEEPTFDPIEAPEGCLGQGITNATKVPASLQIILGEETIYDSGDYVNGESGLTIKVRGNTSAYREKKSYKIKLQKKADLLHRENDDVYKDKEWVLLSSELKLSDHMVGYMVSELMGFPWTPANEFVNVVMNGIYRGIYTLAEPVKRNADCRIDVDEDTGYIIEYDPYWWNEDVYFDSSLSSYYNYTFKYPDSDDVTENQIEYIAGFVKEAEESLEDSSCSNYIDIESFARWLLTHDLLGTSDAAGSNMFMSKYDNTDESKLNMETPWDFDSIECMIDDWAAEHTWSDFYCGRLIYNYNTEFIEKYKSLWKEKEDEVVDQIIENLNSILESELPEAMDYYSPIDKIVSGLDYPTFEEEMEAHKEWFKNRKIWLDENVPEIIESRISLPYLAPSDSIYDIQGRPATSTTRGVIISNGKKYIRK